MSDVRVMIRMPTKLRDQAQREAEEERRNLSNMIRVLIEEALIRREEKTRENTNE